jgi:hypothetical protein
MRSTGIRDKSDPLKRSGTGMAKGCVIAPPGLEHPLLFAFFPALRYPPGHLPCELDGLVAGRAASGCGKRESRSATAACCQRRTDAGAPRRASSVPRPASERHRRPSVPRSRRALRTHTPITTTFREGSGRTREAPARPHRSGSRIRTRSSRVPTCASSASSAAPSTPSLARSTSSPCRGTAGRSSASPTTSSSSSARRIAATRR